jgi:tripartite-type tricarboxylate transporter receptor subunit TctC
MIAGFSRLQTALLALALLSPAATAQQFPTKPVKAIVPFSAGSGPDTVMRLVGEKLARAWGQPVVVDNRPGANGWIGLDAAKKAPADGYTLVQLTNEHASIQPHVYKQLPFDLEKDFEAVAPLYTTHFFVVVAASSPWNSVGDLVAAAKAKPGQVTYGSWGIGSVGHVGGAMLEQTSGVQMTHVSFKELPQLYGSVANGEVAWAMGTAATTVPLYRARKVKYLAIAAPKRLAGFPQILTVSEAGGRPDFVARAVIGLFAPRGVPQPIIERIGQDVAKALDEPEVREKLLGVGFEPFAADARAFAEVLAADSRRYKEVARQAKLTLD